MVLLGLGTMSENLDTPHEPSSPTVEQILEDLTAANEDDIVFKSPPLLSDEKVRTNANVKNTSVANEECNRQYSSNVEDVREKMEKTTEVKMEGQSHEQLYSKVTWFLDNYKALVSSERLLASFEIDLRSKKQQLEEAIGKVNEAWKIEKENRLVLEEVRRLMSQAEETSAWSEK